MLIGGAAFAQSGASRPVSGPDSNCNTTAATGGNPATNNTGLSNCGIRTAKGQQRSSLGSGSSGSSADKNISNAPVTGATNDANAGSMVTGSP
jgi:hypothetical protein